MSLWHIQGTGSTEWGDWRLVAEKEGFEDGRTLKRWERSRYDAQTQLRHMENRYELLEKGDVVYEELHRRSPELRSYGVAQLRALLQEAGVVGITAVTYATGEHAGGGRRNVLYLRS